MLKNMSVRRKQMLMLMTGVVILTLGAYVLATALAFIWARLPESETV